MNRRGGVCDNRLTKAREADGASAVSARQMERWRQHGLLLSNDRTWHGGPGSRSSLPDDTHRRVEAAANAVSTCRDLDEALLSMFGLGWRIELSHLVSAYQRYFDSTSRAILRHRAPHHFDDGDTADAAAQHFARRAVRAEHLRPWRNNARAARIPIADVFMTANTALLGLQPVTDDGVADVAHVVSGRDVTSGPLALPLNRLRDWMVVFSLGRIKRSLGDLTVDELEDARNWLLRVVLNAAEARDELECAGATDPTGFTVIGRLTIRQIAIATPMVACMRRAAPLIVDLIETNAAGILRELRRVAVAEIWAPPRLAPR